MDYDGRNMKTILETKVKIETLAVFENILYWQETNTRVINVIKNATIAETVDTYRNISLARQWSNLTGLVVVNYLPDPICKLVYYLLLL